MLSRIGKKLKKLGRKKRKLALVNLHGAIGSGGRFGSALNDKGMAPVIEQAFASKPEAVVLSVNSPGGAPVQSALIAARIRRLAKQYDIPVLVFCEDVAASGGYWLACAGDEIFADDNSIIGSIGVISAGFGFDGLLDKIGVERRVHSAGDHKSMLDPFRPENPEDIVRLKELQKQIHESFVSYVKDRRGDKLVAEGDKPLFEGDVWLGGEAAQRGLIDNVGHMSAVLTARYGDDVKLRHFGAKKSFWARFGGPSAESAMDMIAERHIWSRWGL